MTAPAQQSNGRGNRLITLFLILATIPWIYSFSRNEIARWYLAAATDADYRSEPSEALELVNQAVAWAPNNLQCRTQQANALLGLADAKEAAAVADLALQIGRDAVEQRATPNNRKQLVRLLNQSAYTHALDGTELQAALANINEAFTILGEITDNRATDAGMLDTRGYLRYLLADEVLPELAASAETAETSKSSDAATTSTDDEESSDPQATKESDSGPPVTPEERRIQNLTAALQDMETAVSLVEEQAKDTKAFIARQALSTIDHAPLKYQRRSLNETMAVLYHHRGQVYEALEKDGAEEDFRRAKQLGYDPENGVW